MIRTIEAIIPTLTPEQTAQLVKGEEIELASAREGFAIQLNEDSTVTYIPIEGTE